VNEYSAVHHPDSIQVTETIVNDRKVSATDLGVYARFLYAATMWHRPDLDLLVNEFHMPREETEASLVRLVAMEYLEPSEKRPEDSSG
jgi:hypothetical protein